MKRPRVEALQTFQVQTFRSKGKGIEADDVKPADDEAHALRLGARLADRKAGVVVLRLDGDPDMGDCDAPIVLAIHGRVPPIYRDLPF